MGDRPNSKGHDWECSSPSADENEQLLKIVGELLLANQELRFEVARLEDKLAQTSRALDQGSALSGMLLP